VGRAVSPEKSDAYAAVILDPDVAADQTTLQELSANPLIEFVDHSAEQLDGLRALKHPPDMDMPVESFRWAYYPWRRSAVKILGPQAFRALRLDRNRNVVTFAEQQELGRLSIGVIGLSVGHMIAHTLAVQGLCGRLRLADFDTLELSNLNRVPATVFDLGINKAVAAARRIAEVDPYLDVTVQASGLTPETMDEFLDGLDIVVEECDSLDMKIAVREAARDRRLPVVMATSDRGLIDVERYDLEPDRPVFHGLLADVDVADLAGLTNKDKVPYVLRILDGATLSSRVAASMIEIGHTVSTWPQLVGDIAVGAATVAEAVRRIGLAEELRSGRARVDIAEALSQLRDPETPNGATFDDAVGTSEAADPSGAIVAAAARAPSGGNVQPWHIEADAGSVVIRLAPEYTSAMDVGLRASAVAVGAATFNARVAAAAHGVLGPVHIDESGGIAPLSVVLRLGTDTDPELAGQYQPMLQRHTNRNRGVPDTLDEKVIASLTAAAGREGGCVHFLTQRDDIRNAAAILAATDRIRYLTPRLHAQMFSELCWPNENLTDWGIDARSLGLDAADLAGLDILRRPEVMVHLANWDAGQALGDDTVGRVAESTALAVVSIDGTSLSDYARGGSAVEALWIAAEQHGLGVQPMSPVFIYAQTRDELDELSPSFAPALSTLQRDFRQLTGIGPGESEVLILRLFHGPPASIPSRRSDTRLRP
jgi:molybdopterin/thiamine biosynthesis adenylyltransferase